MRAQERIETGRLVLRKPTFNDAEAVYSRYASDSGVTKYLSWPTHTSLDHTRAFLRFSDAEWERWPGGPYLIELKASQVLLGGTGLAFEALGVASTGYVLARDAWGQGYATEALGAIVSLASDLGIHELYALCHSAHHASAHVLEKCNFTRESRIEQRAFPNLESNQLADSLRFIRHLK